jgi:cobalamin biosynthesis Mg chelatase CobN
MKNIFLLLIALISIQSCTTLHKALDRKVNRLDSTSKVIEKKDSTGSIDSASLHKENKTAFTKVDSSRSDEQTTINEHTVIKEFNDSGKVNKETTIDKKTETKKGITAGSTTVFENTGKIDSTDLKKQSNVSSQKENNTKVKSVSRETVKTKQTNHFPVIPVVIAGLIIALALFIFFWLRRRKRQIEAAAKLIIPPPGL